MDCNLCLLFGLRAQTPATAASSRERADYLLPPRPCGGVLLSCEPASRVALDLQRAADRHQRTGDGEPAVLERDQRAAFVAPRADVLGHGHAVDLLGEARVAVLVLPAPGGEHGGARSKRRLPHARDLDGPGPPALQ